MIMVSTNKYEVIPLLEISIKNEILFPLIIYHMVSIGKTRGIFINVRHINEDTPFSVALLEISI